MPEISVIILSYNTKAVTLECLDKLKESIDYLKKPVETIVVENGSDGTGEIINRKYKWVKLINPKKNTGYAVGNNLGLKVAKGKFLLCLNSDAFLQKKTLRQSLDFFGSHPNCDVLGCQLRLADGRVQPSAGYLPTPQNIYLWMIWFGNQVHPQSINFFSEEKPVEWVMGAFLMMRRKVYEITHGFNESYFLYGEEVEWCQRIKNAGFMTWYSPAIQITHLDKTSSGGDLTPGIIKEIEGIKYFIHTYYPHEWWGLKWIIKLGMFERYIAFNLLGQSKRANACLQASKTI